MRNYIIFLFLAFFSFYSCNNDINLNEDFKEIPVVYGILNPQDSAQYIRLERVFNDPETSALIIAKYPDSVYYKDAKVFLVDKNQNRYELQKIDANLDNFPRDTGAFVVSPNYLYKIRQSDLQIEPGSNYELIALDKNEDTLTSGKTNVVKNMLIYLPSDNSKPVKLPYISNFNISWSGGENASYFDIFLIFNIQEKNTVTNSSWENKQIIWKAGEYVDANTFKIIGINFYKSIGLLLEVNPDIKRRFLSFDIKVRGVGSELKELKDILNINTGITSSQSLPTYTNLSEGYGIFSSINSVDKKSFLLDELTRDSLKYGIYTRALNFE